MYTERTKQLREEYQMPQRQFSAAWKLTQLPIAKSKMESSGSSVNKCLLFQNYWIQTKKELLIFWLADKVIEVIENRKELADKVLRIVQQKIN